MVWAELGYWHLWTQNKERRGGRSCCPSPISHAGPLSSSSSPVDAKGSGQCVNRLPDAAHNQEPQAQLCPGLHSGHSTGERITDITCTRLSQCCFNVLSTQITWKCYCVKQIVWCLQVTENDRLTYQRPSSVTALKNSHEALCSNIK